MTSDFRGPDRAGGGRTAVEPTIPVDDLLVESPGGYRLPPNRPGSYWTGLVALAIGLAVTVVALATRVTSIVQTVLLAVPLALVGLGLERVGRGVGRGSLRAVGALLVVVAVIGPVALSLLTSPEPGVYWTPNGNPRRTALDKLKADYIPAHPAVPAQWQP